MGGVLLADVVATSTAVTATRSRTAKTTALAALLGAAAAGEVAAVTAFLAGAPRQGRIGTGWVTLTGLDVEPAPVPSLGVGEVDEALSTLQAVSGPGSTAARRDLLGRLLSRATANEQRFLIGLLTGELRQGALEGVMLDAVAAAAEVPSAVVRRAFMLSGRLPETAAAALSGGAAALAAFHLELGRPVRPMLASPADSLEAALADVGPASVEHKLDGARIQVHRDGDDVGVWTRTLREITASVPELVAVVRGMPCRSVVLDGETLALADDGRPRPFQETMSRFGIDARTRERFFGAASGELLLHPYFFDCLHLDGEDLLDAPLRDRLAALDRVAAPYRIPSVQDGSAAPALLAAALAAGHEGVMVKSLSSPYAAGRRGRAWQKVKPVHTLDLVVLAAEWGHGRRRGWLSNLHLGARDPDRGAGDPDSAERFVMVGKTFKGLTDALLTWQTAALQEIAVRTDRYTVHVRPSLVVEIELDGVQTSPRYPGGVALRFARVLRFRPDKDAAEADTIDAVRALGTPS